MQLNGLCYWMMLTVTFTCSFRNLWRYVSSSAACLQVRKAKEKPNPPKLRNKAQQQKYQSKAVKTKSLSILFKRIT